MISKKMYIADGSNTRYLTDFIIRSEQYTRPYNYIYDASLPSDGTGDVLQDGTTDQANWRYPDNIWKRGGDAPASNDLVTSDKWQVVDNSIMFYIPPQSNSKVWIEVASTPEEFGETLIQPSVAIVEEARDVAVAASTAAKTSETNAKTSEDNAKVSETNAKTSETNAKTSETNTKTSENNAKTSENNAKVSENNAKTSENNAKTSENNAKTSEDNAKVSEDNAKVYADSAEVSAYDAKQYAESVNADTILHNIKADKVITVGSGGDYATINEALEEASKAYPLYIQGGYLVEIKLLAGFVMQEQVIVKDIDLGYITITGEDDETVIQRDTLTVSTTNEYDGTNRYGAFNAINATLPVIGQLFNMDDSGDSDERSGVYAVAGSKVNVLKDCGVKNAGQYGILVYKRSEAHIEGSIFSGATHSGVYTHNNSTINATSVDASNAGTYGIYAYDGSTINAKSVDASNAGTYGIRAYNQSSVNAHLATVTDAGSTSIVADSNSDVSASSSNCTSNGDYEYYVNKGSTINITAYKGDKKTNTTINEWGAKGSVTL